MKLFPTLFLTSLLLFTSTLPASMEYFKGEGEELKIEKEAEIKLLTWNILGLPADYCATRPWEERIEGIAALIRAENPDLLFLQECFDPKLSEELFERLKDLYPHSFLHLKSNHSIIPSGLVLFSKLPIGDFHFTPHANLLDDEGRYIELGTCDFNLLNQEGLPLAHIAGSHFLGPSRCEWRKGITQGGQRLSYEDVRQEQAEIALNLPSIEGIPRYLCGDLNVERNSTEFFTSLLNPIVNSSIMDGWTAEGRLQPTNTSYFEHLKDLGKTYPELPQEELLGLMKTYKELAQHEILPLLKKEPWNRPLSEFDPLFFKELEQQMDLSTKEREMCWHYFVNKAENVLSHEKELWKENGNYGEAPPVFMVDILEVHALPFYEALDFILGLNPYSRVEDVTILQGFDESDQTLTLSDHHPLRAKIKLATAD